MLKKIFLLQLITSTILASTTKAKTDTGECDELRKQLKEERDMTDKLQAKIDHEHYQLKKITKLKGRGFFRRTFDYAFFQQWSYKEGHEKELILREMDSYDLDRTEFGGIRHIQLQKGGLLFKNRIIIDWTNPGRDITFTFTDESGDTYKLWCRKSGKRHLDYNSELPNIMKVSW